MQVLSMALSLCVLVLAGCKSSDPNAAAPASPASTSVGSTPVPTARPSPVALKSKIDPCKLLTSDELKAVQGEALQETFPSERETTELVIAQCYYQLPTITNSIVVNVTTPKDRRQALRAFWRKSFLENAGTSEERKGGETEARPGRISEVGEETYWEASGIAGALYVLKKDVIFRISIGGASDLKTKLEKSKTLAQKALARI